MMHTCAYPLCDCFKKKMVKIGALFGALETKNASQVSAKAF